MSEFLKTIPRVVYGQLNDKTDGAAITSGASIYVVVDGGTYLAGAGSLAHKGGGLWEYLPASSEANSDSCLVHFVHINAISDRVVFYGTPKRIRELEDITASEIDTLLTTNHGAGLWSGANELDVEVVVNSFTSKAISQLAGQGISIVSPLLMDGTISLVQGDDYLNIDGRSLNFFSKVEDQWPDLTGASVHFLARQQAEFWQVSGEVIVATGIQHVRVELNSTATNNAPGWWDYQLALVLSNNHRLTIVQGRMQIINELSV